MAITRFAQNDLVRLSYEVDGPDTVAVVLMLHSTLADRAAFAPLRDTLVERYRVILPDARGHGGSSAIQGRTLTVADLANDIYTVLEAEKLLGDDTQVHLVGYGQGAIAALELTRIRPDLVASLTLLEPDALSILEGETDPDVIADRERARTANRESADAAYKGLADKAIATYLDRRWGEKWRDQLARPRQAAIRRNVMAISPSLDALDHFRVLPEDLATISTPSRIVAAATSPLAERTIATRLGSWLPQGRSVFVAELPGGAPFSGAGLAAVNLIEEWIDSFAI